MRDKCGRQGEDKCKLMQPKAAQSGRQVWEISVGDKCKLMRPKAPRVRDKCGRQGGDKCKLMRLQRHPEWETSVGIKWETSVNSCGSKDTQSERQVWETRGRQV